jgi:RHS repeat-associated protein
MDHNRAVKDVLGHTVNDVLGLDKNHKGRPPSQRYSAVNYENGILSSCPIVKRKLTNEACATRLAGQQGHFPFGESWYAQNSTSKWQFTSYEHDSESGNEYALARSYINRLARFSSPDPAGLLVADPSNPQSWNRYAYVLNNPLAFIDPFGLTGFCSTGDYTDQQLCRDAGGIWTDDPGPCGASTANSCVNVSVPAPPTFPTSDVPLPDQLPGGNRSSSTAAKACVQPTKLQRAGIALQGAVAKLTGSTFGVGAGATLAGGNRLGVTLAVSRQVVVSPSGQAAFVTTVTPISPIAVNSYVSPGVSGYGGFQISFSNAPNPQDLNGPALDFGYRRGRRLGRGR